MNTVTTFYHASYSSTDAVTF